MKRDFRPWTLDLGLCACVFIVAGGSAFALTEDNPYAAIVGRNAFALKPPPRPEDLNKTPPPAAPDIKLQGISTILGRKQVIMKVKTVARPQEPAKDQSVMLGEGEREGDVEVLEINAIEGIVKVNNGSTPLTLTMADNSEKPAAGPALPGTGAGGPPPARLPGVPPPMTAPASAEPARATPTIPTRTLRTGTEGASANPMGASTMGMSGGTAASMTATPSASSQRSVEENVAIYEVNRLKNEKLREAGVKVPKMPPHPFLKRAEESAATQ
jgi:hypothetical protein